MNKIFYGGIFMDTENLRHNGIYNPIKIDYYKTEEILTEENKVKYGIEIVKTEYKDDEKTNIEINNIYEISNKEKEVDEILKIFKENDVTPIGAEDIISDYFYNYNVD